MSLIRKTTHAVTVLLALLMSTMLVLPPGMDLALCFGNDGHVDISLIGCQDGASPKIPARQRPPVHETVHHDDCRHIAMACGIAQELARTYNKTDSYKSELKKDPSKTPRPFSKSLTDSTGASLDSNVYFIRFEDFASPHLVSFRTVVLVI